MTDRLWYQRDPMEYRGPDGSGRTAAGWVGLGLALLWSAAMWLALSVANSLSDADLAGPGAVRHPLDDPPVAVARAEFLVGVVGIAALPVAIAVILLGHRGVVRGWVAGNRVGWVALVVGGVGLLPAVLACLFGVLICVLDGGVIGAG